MELYDPTYCLDQGLRDQLHIRAVSQVVSEISLIFSEDQTQVIFTLGSPFELDQVLKIIVFRGFSNNSLI